MGKKKTGKAAGRITGGPFVQLAAICEKALHDDRGSASLIQIIDTITVHGLGKTMEPGAINFAMVVGFKSCGFVGKKTVTIATNAPDGSAAELQKIEQEFKGAQAGTMIILNSFLGVKDPGLYWFDVKLDGVTATKIPLLVQYEQKPKPATPAQQATVQGRKKGR